MAVLRLKDGGLWVQSPVGRPTSSWTHCFQIGFRMEISKSLAIESLKLLMSYYWSPCHAQESSSASWCGREEFQAEALLDRVFWVLTQILAGRLHSDWLPCMRPDHWDVTILRHFCHRSGPSIEGSPGKAWPCETCGLSKLWVRSFLFLLSCHDFPW